MASYGRATQLPREKMWSQKLIQNRHDLGQFLALGLGKLFYKVFLLLTLCLGRNTLVEEANVN